MTLFIITRDSNAQTSPTVDSTAARTLTLSINSLMLDAASQVANHIPNNKSTVNVKGMDKFVYKMQCLLLHLRSERQSKALIR